MVQQEETGYSCPNYVAEMAIPESERDPEKREKADFGNNGLGCLNEAQRQMHRRRDTISAWLYEVVDQCDLSREIVAVAMSFLDRFIATIVMMSSNAVNGYIYQLAALTALYMSVKLHDHRPIRIERLAQLSRGRFTKEDMKEMERSMLTALEWRMHPPTAVAFVHEFLKLVFVSDQENEVENEAGRSVPGVASAIFELAQFFTELSVIDYKLCVNPNRPSMIAYASILNAMERISLTQLEHEVRCLFLDRISSVCPHLTPFSANVSVLRRRLLDVYDQSFAEPDSHAHPRHSKEHATAVITPPRPVSSPVCVSSWVDVQLTEQEESQETATMARTKRFKHSET